MATIDPKTGLPITDVSNAAIPTSALSTPQTPIKVASVADQTPIYNAGTTSGAGVVQSGLDLAQKQADELAAQNKYVEGSNTLSALQSQVSGKAADQASAYAQTGGVNDLYKQLSQLNVEAQGLNRQTLANPLQQQEAAIGTGRTQGQVESITAQNQRQIALKALDLGQRAAIAQGNYDVAKNLADQQIEAKYAGLTAQIEAQKTNLAALDKIVLTPAQEKRKEAANALLKKQEQDRDERIANEKELKNLSLTISKNGAPSSVVSKIANAKTFNDAVIAAAPYMQSLTDKADISYKLAQTAKIYNDIRNDNATSGGNVDPSQMLAYSQQYASTGTIPTGIPKGSFGKIAQYAKELPKPTGSLVDINTGVRPSKLGAEEEKGISATYDIVNNKLPLLLEKFNKINTGIVGGTLGNVFTSQDRQDFETTRGEILNLLLQARSGATVSPQEYERYSKLIPTTFNQMFFLGSDGEKKINSLQKSLNDTLGSKLRTSGASIYGYSKVDINGKEYTVGDIITAPNGQHGRINPDGSVTLVQ